MPFMTGTELQVTQPIAIFGDVDLGIWGLLIVGEQPRLAIAALDSDPAEIALEPATVDRDDGDGGDDGDGNGDGNGDGDGDGDWEVWSVTSGRHSLRLEQGQATTLTPGGDIDLQPLRVTGTATLAGEPIEIDVAGVLSESGLDSRAGSSRLFGSWFPAGHQIVLRARRPRGARGQDRDQIDVVALGEKDALVFDPRLSTTYDAVATPRQAGLELWIGPDEEGDQYPRRVSSVATGSSITVSTDGATLNATALQCLSRGEIGVGVYVLFSAE